MQKSFKFLFVDFIRQCGSCTLWFKILISFVNEREICAICKILSLEEPCVYIQSLSHMTVITEVRSFCWVRLHDPLYNFMLIGENLLHVHSFNFQEQACNHAK